MHVILDHLAAVVVSSVLVLLFALMQVRGVQSAGETTVNHMVRSATLDIALMLERDLENMRTDAQVQEAIARGILSGGTAFNCTATASADTTMQFTFPTLEDPQSAAGLADPNDAPVALVTYQLTPAADSLSRLVNGLLVTHPLFQLQRFIDGVYTGGTQATVTDFRVLFATSGSGTFIPANAACPADLNKVRFQLQMGLPGYNMEGSGQTSTSQLNFSRHGVTVNLINWQ